VTWVRLDDSAPLHPKLLAAGPEAAWLWVAGLAYANRHTTNGVIPPQALTALYPSDQWPRARLAKLATTLVTAGLWTVREAGGWEVHDYAQYQAEAMRDAVAQRRAWERDRKARQRAAQKSRETAAPTPADSKELPPMSHRDRGGTVPWDNGGTEGGTTGGTSPRDTDGTTTGDSHALEEGLSQVVSQPPGPARPDPTSETSLREVDATSASGARGAEQLALLTLLTSDDATPPAANAARRERPRKADAPAPMPFKIGEALAALAETAQGRFAPGEARDITKAVAIPITAAIRSYPSLDEWRLVGAWLAAGGQAHRGTLGVAWASSSGLREAMALSRAWHAAGRPPVDPREAAAAARATHAPVTASSPKDPRIGIQPPAPASAFEHVALARALGVRWPGYEPTAETKEQAFLRITGRTIEDARAEVAARKAASP
jgi:hypothetical protein